LSRDRLTKTAKESFSVNMDKAIIFILFLIFQTSDCQEQTTTTPVEETGVGLQTAACVFGCLDAFQRKGVEEPGVVTEAPAQNTCNGLDLESLIRVCKNYQRADTCLGQCVKSETKKIIISGLDYICVHRFEDFKKYMPCYQEHCASMEEQCADRCGSMSSAKDHWWSKMGNPASSSSRRKRQNADGEPATTTTASSAVDATDSSTSSGDTQVSDSELDTCQFVGCFVNCSRPFMENECGKDAYELLKQSSRILLSFVLSPLEDSWASENITMTAAMAACNGYVSEALTDEKNAAYRPAFVSLATILLLPLALLGAHRFH